MSSELLIRNRINELNEKTQEAREQRDILNKELEVLNKIIDSLEKYDSSFLDIKTDDVVNILNDNALEVKNIEEVLFNAKNIVEYYILNNNTDFKMYDEYKVVLDELKSKLIEIKSKKELLLSNNQVDYSNDISRKRS